MATSNFETQKGFPLFATEQFDGFYYEDEETGETAWADGDSWSFRQAQDEIEEFSENLKYYGIELKGGYYSGVQVVLTRKTDINGYEKEYAGDYSAKMWNQNRKEEKRYYGGYYDFDLPYAARLKAEQREIRQIINYCRTTLHDRYGFDEYVVTAKFSNGETWYGLANEERNRLKAAAIA